MKRFTLILFVVLLGLAACGHNTNLPNDKGNMPISIDLQPAIAHGFNVDNVVVTITKGSFNATQQLTIDGSSASGSFEDLEIGTYAIDVSVYDDTLLIAQGSGTGTVRPGQTTTVYITLHFTPGGLEIFINWGLPYEDSRRVLLVGNSHTYFNGGVNTHLQALIDAAHPEWGAVISAQTGGGYTLENHYSDPNTLNAISEGNWDLVILQEQSSRPMTDPDLFYQYSTLLNTVITQSGALTGFYMTWAWRNNPEMYEPIRDAYNYIGAFLDAEVNPAGVAYHNAMLNHDCPLLYAPDNYHPSIYGTYLVACVMLAEIWNVDPVGNTYFPAEIDAATALFLQEVAWDTVQAENSKHRTGKHLYNPFSKEKMPLAWDDRGELEALAM